MRLYELSQEYERIAAVLLDDNGELSATAEDMLSQLAQDLKKKAESICCLIQRFHGEAESAGKEAERLKALADKRHAAAERLKAYLFHHLQQFGIDVLDTDKFHLRIHPNSRPSISWTRRDEDIPPEYWRQPPPTPNYVLAHLHHKKGIPLPDGFQIVHGSHLSIS